MKDFGCFVYYLLASWPLSCRTVDGADQSTSIFPGDLVCKASHIISRHRRIREAEI